MSELDRVIHEPARLLIVALLHGVKDADFVYLLRESDLTKGNLSSHPAKLEQAGYFEIEKTYRGNVPFTIIRLSKPDGPPSKITEPACPACSARPSRAADNAGIWAE